MAYRTYSLPPSQRPLTTAEQSYIEITYYSVTTMKLSALVLIASARSFIATAMPRNETSTIVAANSSSLVLLNATSQTMSDANQSLQPDVENMDEEKCLGGEEGCVVEYGKRRFRRPDPCTASPSPSSLPIDPAKPSHPDNHHHELRLYPLPTPPDNQTNSVCYSPPVSTMSGSLQVPFPPPAYQLQDLKYDGNRVAAAVEEGRPASLGRSRTAEPGGRELAWSKAKFVVAVLILATQMAGLGIMVYVHFFLN
ncbi:hypothetical protein F4801DRAFT_583292 [Xylaria longipes]|nr:hypothetical protein F4801DRAFT_583292 [Xylaria longipes]